MRVNKRHQSIMMAQTELQIELHAYQDKEDLLDVAMLQRLTIFLSKRARFMRNKTTPKLETRLDKLVWEFQQKHEMTDIEMMQAIHDFCSTKLKFMLRYERHGNYDKPAGLE